MSNLSPFSLELDHVVIFVSPDAPEAQSLAALGLDGFGGVTRHGDLGTASTAFFFENTYLELFWAHDEDQARAKLLPVGMDIGARMRWRETGASPFGLMLCRHLGATHPIPFPTRSLRAEWMPGEVAIDFAGSEAAEPYVGVVPEALAYRSFRAGIPAPAHPLGVRRLSAIRMTTSRQSLSATARLLVEQGLVVIEPALEPLMELTFDGGAAGKSLDLRPILPLRLKY
ncbi:MAG: VOC family protein [Anaerolineae bacterium]|nr:VOC family protein [Anaerolineae bacterium]